MRYVRPATTLALLLVCCAAFGQAQGLSIAKYELVEVQEVAPNMEVTFRVEVVNTGAAALPPMVGRVTSLDPTSIRVAPGAGTLNFPAVSANGEVTSSNTVTFLVSPSAPIDFSQLQWVFQAIGPVANAGPNQTVPVGRVATLNGSGSTNPGGVGTLTYSWVFTSLPPGSNANLEDASSPTPWFTVDVQGSYTVQLTVGNGVSSSIASVIVSTGRTPPVAHAGPNQTVQPGATVILNGSASTSSSGLPLSYAWTLVARPLGSTAALTGMNTVSPSFVVDKEGVYQAKLIVNDGLASNPATVTITTGITAPVANAGASQVVDVGALVQLNGAGSTDANGLMLTYSWRLLSVPAGSTAALKNPTEVNPTFTADKAGTYVAQLIVNNGQLSSDPATVTITTQTPAAPTANAGQNLTVSVGSLVSLSGSGTVPPGLPLEFHWSLIGKPSGSAASLSSAVISDPTFVADRSGTYVAQLIVNDGLLNSTPSTVAIRTSCSQPQANPGTNQNVAVGQQVTLDGSASADSCNDPLTYLWVLTTRPRGSATTLSNRKTATPTFVPDLPGAYVAQLIVNNGVTSSTPATVTIRASTGSVGAMTISLPANVVVGVNQSVAFPVTLSAAAPSGLQITLQSSDPDVMVSPAAITIPQGGIKSSVVPMATGVIAGSATITASAAGLASTSQVVQVTPAAPAAMSFSPGSLMVSGTSTQNLMLVIPTAAPPGGLLVQITSNNPGVATVPATVGVAANSTSALVPVTGVAAGSATITASAANYLNATANVSVSSTQGISVTWYGACWVNTTIYGVTGNFQATLFSMVTPAPAPLQGTLFYAPNCDPSQGNDNLNDYGILTGSGTSIQGFTHHPNLIPSSAIYWIGPLTSDGMCPAGAPCSGCVNYTKTTPYCSSLP